MNRGRGAQAAWVLVVAIGSSCATTSSANKSEVTPSSGETFQKVMHVVRDVTKVAGGVVIDAKICGSVEKTYSFEGGSFVVEHGNCTARETQGGDLLLQLHGTGGVSRFLGLAALRFSVEATARFAKWWEGDRIYLLPRDVSVSEPSVLDANIGARIAESLGLVGNSVRQQLTARVDRPRTFFLAGMCTADGWVPLGELPTECEKADGSKLRLGTFVALGKAPADWEPGTPIALKLGLEQQNVKGDQLGTALRSWVEANKQSLAKELRSRMHPSGRDERLVGSKVIDNGDQSSLLMTIQWSGALLRTQYETVVRWNVASTNHIQAVVESDTAKIPVAEKNRIELDEFFRDQAWPQISALIEKYAAVAKATSLAAHPKQAVVPPPQPRESTPATSSVEEQGEARQPLVTRSASEDRKVAPTELQTKTQEAPAEAWKALERGAEALRLNELRVAEISFEDALRVAPKWGPALNGLGNVASKNGQLAEAIGHYRAAVEADASFSLAWFNLASAQRKAGDFASSVNSFETYVSLMPSDPAGYFGLARAYEDLKVRSGAIVAYEKYIALEQRESEQGSVEKARRAVEQLKNAKP